jgi:hypothetical protein
MTNDTSAFEAEFADKSSDFPAKSADMRQAMQELEIKLELDYADAWLPEEGESILGVITSISMGPDAGFGSYPIITILTNDGESKAVHAFHTVLKERLIDIRPAVDEIIGIKYVGHVMPEDGTKNVNDYYAYKVLINRPDADIWDKFTPKDTTKP